MLFPLITLQITAVVSGCLHGNAMSCHPLVVERTRKDVNVHGVYHVWDVVQFEVPLLGAGDSHVLVFDKRAWRKISS